MRPLRGGSPQRPVRCTAYRPNIGALLPVYVADRYEGIEARTFAECSEQEVERYIDANVAAVREICALVAPQLALANHLVMGPVILARALGGEVPYAVKVHGSALEYTVKPDPERFLGFAREGVAGARAILVGSHHTATSLWQALADPEVVERTRLGPPGVDIELFSPREPARAATGVRALAARMGADRALEGSHGPATDAFARDQGAAAEALERLDPDRDRLVAFVGKLIVSKGVDLLLAAWPIVLEQVPDARLVVVGFGAYREGLERISDALLAGDIGAVRRSRSPAGSSRINLRLRGRFAICWRSSTDCTEPSASAIWPRPAISTSGSCSPDVSSMRSSPICCRRARRWWCRAPFPRPSEWSRRRPPRAECCRSPQRTRGWPR